MPSGTKELDSVLFGHTWFMCSSTPKRSTRRRFWRRSFIGRALGLSLASGLGGVVPGALIGLTSFLGNAIWFTTPAKVLLALVWRVLLFGICAHVGVMLLHGFLTGAIVFGVLETSRRHWNAKRKIYFGNQMKRRVFRPVLLSVSASSFAIALFWLGIEIVQPFYRVTLWSGSSPQWSELNDIITYCETIALLVSTCVFVFLLACSSATAPTSHRVKRQRQRLLPLD